MTIASASPRIDRRGMLGLAGAGMIAAALPARAALPERPAAILIRAGGARYAAALAAIRAYAMAELDTTGLPGMVLSIVDAHGFAATICVGWSDADRRVPVEPDQLFQIGSISKSFAALWLHAAADRGRVDLSAPVSRYLPDVPLPPEPITLRQLLNHVGGLPSDGPIFPRAPGGRLWTGYAPGTRFSYSNVGYTLLGMVIDRVAGQPHSDVLAKDVLVPLGMPGALARIVSADRAREVLGYAPLVDDRPALTRVPLAPGPWTQMDMAAGSIVASGDDMAAYLRYVLALGQGKGGLLMSDSAARGVLANPVAADEFGAGARYSSGFAHVVVGGRPALHHTGGMMLFSSSFHADPAAGVACFASVNSRLDDYRPRRTTAFAIEALRAAAERRAIPPAPDPSAFRAVTKPEDYVGRYVSAGGDAIELRQAGSALVLTAQGGTARVEQFGHDMLATDHPLLGAHFLQFARRNGAVDRLWWGPVAYGHSGAPPRQPVSPRLKALEGRYVSGDPWTGGTATIFARGNSLILEGVGEIVERGGGFWSSAHDPGGVDRFWFDAPLNGRPSRLSSNGADLIRVT